MSIQPTSSGSTWASYVAAREASSAADAAYSAATQSAVVAGQAVASGQPGSGQVFEAALAAKGAADAARSQALRTADQIAKTLDK